MATGDDRFLRTYLAFVIAPLWVPIGAGIMWGELMAGAGLVISYVVIFLIGVPFYRLARAAGFTSVWWAIGGGGITALVAWPVVLVLFGLSLGLSFDLAIDTLKPALGNPRGLANLAVVVGLGTLVGLTQWLIARPDHRPAPADGR